MEVTVCASALKRQKHKQHYRSVRKPCHIVENWAVGSYSKNWAVPTLANIYTLSKMLTHKNVSTTQIYGEVVNQKKHDAANSITQK